MAETSEKTEKTSLVDNPRSVLLSSNQNGTRNTSIRVASTSRGTTARQLYSQITEPSAEEILISCMCEAGNLPSAAGGTKKQKGKAGVCVHPQWNYHAYQEVSIATRLMTSFASWKLCHVCQERLNGRIIYCVSCTIYAHRECGFNKSIHVRNNNKQKDSGTTEGSQRMCPVNNPLVSGVTSRLSQPETGEDLSFHLVRDNECTREKSTQNNESSVHSPPQQHCNPSVLDACVLDKISLIESGNNGEASISATTCLPMLTSTLTIESKEGKDPPASFVSMWSLPSIMQDLFATSAEKTETAKVEKDETPKGEEVSEPINNGKISLIEDKSSTNDSPSGDGNSAQQKTNETASSVSIEPDPKSEEESQTPSGRNNFLSKSFANVFESSSTAVDVTSKTTKVSLGMASVTGQIVGGAAGLALAGPAGALIGSKLGSAACILTVLIRGRRVILIGAGALAAGLTIQKSIAQGRLQNTDFHLLPLNSSLLSGSAGKENNVMLIRPNIQIDPEWVFIVERATEEYCRNGKAIETIDTDIVNATEVDTREKVLLLVARNLNDKRSYAGFMYRSLIKEHKQRSEPQCQQEECDEKITDTAVPPSDAGVDGRSPSQTQSQNDGTSNDEDTEANPLLILSCPQNAKTDAHAVIIKVTEALLKTQRSLSASGALREMTTDAVEIFILGELYQSIFDAIVVDTEDRDNALDKKIEELGNEIDPSDMIQGVSCEAVKMIQSLGSSCSAVEKLECFVTFLEFISDSWSGGAMDADSLLGRVCCHIVLARVPNIHAEVMFAEEFAKDEQLLRGKLGYALVTMQASLHILGNSPNIREFLD
jgi:hypothetical protein